MISLSLCMIVKNEEKVLKRCLDSSYEIFDEIIIVDTGSNDKSKEIASKYTDKIYDFKWNDDFSAARNFAFQKSTKDYIMWLDADDIISFESKNKLINLLKNFNSLVDFVMMPYDVSFDENGNTTMSYYRERIIKNNKSFKWIGMIHEVIVPTGNIIYSDITVIHKKEIPTSLTRNLKIYNKMKKLNISFDARQTFYFARELYYNKKFHKAITNFNIFLNMTDAWIENKIAACIDLANSYFEINNSILGIASLFKSFSYDTPRAEVCVEIGKYFLANEMLNEAIFWNKLALTITPNPKNCGFYLPDSYNYIPYINLCVCYYKLGNIYLSNLYNEIAGKIKPNDATYLNNQEFFKKKSKILNI